MSQLLFSEVVLILVFDLCLDNLCSHSHDLIVAYDLRNDFQYLLPEGLIVEFLQNLCDVGEALLKSVLFLLAKCLIGQIVLLFHEFGPGCRQLSTDLLKELVVPRELGVQAVQPIPYHGSVDVESHIF